METKTLLIVGGAVVVGLVLLRAIGGGNSGGGGGGGASTAGVALASQSLAAQTNIALANIDGATNRAAMAYQTQQAMGALAAGVAMHQQDAGVMVQGLQTSQMFARGQIAQQMNKDTILGSIQLNAQKDLTMVNLAQISAQSHSDLAKIQTGAAISLAGIGAENRVDLAQIGSSRDITLAQINSDLQKNIVDQVTSAMIDKEYIDQMSGIANNAISTFGPMMAF